MLDRFENWDADKLTQNERGFLYQLNERLTEIEKQLKTEVSRLLEVGKEQRKASDLWNIGYEIECELEFFISENDPAWDEEDDNILVVVDESYREQYFEREFGICDRTNHNEYRHHDTHPMKGEFHCWLYHCLYHHTSLSWGNILRIDSIEIDLKLCFQGEVGV